jgi:hypothetical protein
VTTQLDLFQRPSATIFLFPLHRRTQFVRAVASRISGIRGRVKRQKYWDDLISNLSRDLHAGGCSKLLIDDHLTRFWKAVDAEMAKLRAGAKTHADGAA